jgi:thymidylate synthase (FAD)
MKLIPQHHEIIQITPNALYLIERAGRTCYRTCDKITDDSSSNFAQMILDKGHESVIEHASMTVKFTTSRNVTHEMVRHRIASFSERSTRYVDLQQGDMEFIEPIWWPGASDTAKAVFESCLEQAEKSYRLLRAAGWRPEQAREVLPGCLATEIVVTANLREWRHILKLRTSKAAHPQMRALMCGLLGDVRIKMPVIFEWLAS